MSDQLEPTILNPIQKKIVGAAITGLACSVILALVIFSFFAIKQTVGLFSNIIWPLVISGILALLLRPIVLFSEKFIKLSRVKSIILLYVLVLLVCFGITALIIPIIIEQIIDFTKVVPQLIGNAREYIDSRLNINIQDLQEKLYDGPLIEYVDSFYEGIKNLLFYFLTVVLDSLSKITNTFAWIAGFAVVPIYLFYFLETNRDPSRDIENELSFINSNLRNDIIFLIREFVTILIAFFRGQLLIGLIMGFLLAMGFTLAGLKFGIILGLSIGLLNVVPYFGTIIGLLLVLPIAFFQPEGGFILVGISLGVFVIVQIIEGYLLTPKIMGRQTGLHPLVVIIAIFFWGTALNGLLGMILAIPLTAFIIVAWRLVKIKYLDNLNTSKAKIML